MLKEIEAKTKLSGSEGSDDAEEIKVSFQFNIPDTLKDACEQYGEDAVYDLFVAKLVINVQGYARQLIKDATPLDQVASACAAWTPATKTVRSPAARARSAFAAMSDDERRAVLNEFGLLG